MKKFSLFFALAISLIGFSSHTKAIFTDVPVESWYYLYVQNLLDKGIIDDADTFRPGDPLVRAELVKVVLLSIGEKGEDPLPGHPTFDDVPHDTWFGPLVERAATLAIVSGYADAEGNLSGLFGPGDEVTRAQLAKIIVEAFDFPQNQQSPKQFSDVLSNDWFYGYVQTMSGLGIVEGYEDGTFKPHQPVTRSEMAKMLSLAMTVKANGNEPVEGSDDPDEPVDAAEEEPANEENPNSEEEPTEETPAEEVLFKANTNTITPAILIPGKEIYIGRYNFEGQLEGYTIDTITLVNDTTGNILGDDAKGSVAIKNVILKFPNKDGYLKTVSMPINANGKARFGNLDFFAKRMEETPLEIYVTLNEFSALPEGSSGEMIRVGIQNTNNDLSSFRALGEFSNQSLTYGDDGLTVLNNNTELYTVRKSAPTFKLVKEAGPLVNGTASLYALEVTANQASSLALGRLVFEIATNDNDGNNLNLSDFEVHDGSGLIDDVTVYDTTGGQNLSPNGGGSLTNGISKVIVSFDEEQTIAAGQTRTFTLKATITGVATEDSVSIRLEDDDEQSPLNGLSAEFQENTGKLFVNGDAAAGIFFGSATDFSQLVTNNTNILWTDFSAKSHLSPEITNGSVTSNSGTTDWTNGYLLRVSSLGSSVLN